MSRQRLAFLGSAIATLGLVSLVVYAQDPGGYDVKTRLENINEVGPIKNANELVEDNVFHTITERCEASGIPSSYFGVCCQQPIYWLNPACPYQMKGQDLVYDPENQFGSDEENQAYQSVIDCLGDGGTAASCQRPATVDSLINDAKNKYDTCYSGCDATYQSCQKQCYTPTTNSDGPFEDSRANAAYRSAVSCLRRGGDCFREILSSGVPSSWVHDILDRAYHDVQNGTVWQPPRVSQEEAQSCLNSCKTAGETCVGNCPGYQDVQNKVLAAAQKALNDWQTSEDTPPEPPVAKPLTSELQDAETHAQEINSNKITDANGKEVMPQDVLRGGLDETNPVVTLQFPLKKIQAGEQYNAVISAGPPEAFPVQEIVFTPDQSIANGSLAVMVGDNSKAPMFIGAGAPGPSDYDRPRVSPDPQQYQLQDYIRLGATIDPKASPLEHDDVSYSDMLFHLVVAVKDLLNPFSAMGPTTPESGTRLASISMPWKFVPVAQAAETNTTLLLLHYNKKTDVWDELPTEKGICSDDYCTYTVKSPSASTFALVLKKNIPPAVHTPAVNSNTNSTVTKLVQAMTSSRKPLQWFGLVVWAGLIYWLYRQFWQKNAQSLKSHSLGEQAEAVHQIGFRRMVFLAGTLLFGNGLAIVFAALILSRQTLSASVFFGVLLLSIIAGFVFGLILWIVFASVRHFRR